MVSTEGARPGPLETGICVVTCSLLKRERFLNLEASSGEGICSTCRWAHHFAKYLGVQEHGVVLIVVRKGCFPAGCSS